MFFSRNKSKSLPARQGTRRYVRALEAVKRPMFDALEPRVMLSAVITQLGNTLSITCNNDSDYIQIVDLGAGSVSVGASTSPGPVQAKLYSNVLHIKLDSGGGDDSITCVGQAGGGGGGALFDVFADLSISTGAGADTVKLSYLKIKGDLSVTSSLGDGADSIQFDVSEDMSGVTSPIQSSSLHDLKWKLDGGAGNDTARCSFFDVFLDSSVTMGAGNDSFVMKHKGEIHLAADMGDGNDSFSASGDGSTSNAASPALYASSLFIKYWGQAGNDDCSLTGNDVFCDASVDQGGGNDSLYMKMDLSSTNKFVTPAGMVSDTRLYLLGGDGNDRAVLVSHNPFSLQQRTCLVFVDEGAGNDSFTADCTTTGSSSSNLLASSLYMKLDGGAGNDSVQCSFFDVFTELSCDMGAGSDDFTVKLDGIKGECVVDASLGTGDDTFTLTGSSSASHQGYVPPVGASPDGLFIKVDGSDGNDSISTDCTDVFCDFSVDGGAGSDRIFQKMMVSDILSGDAPLDMQADCRLSILGGDGSDIIQTTLLLPAVQRSRYVETDVDCGGGSDQFTFSAAGATAAKDAQKVKLDMVGGDGSDAFACSFFDVFTEVALDGGAGDDSAYLKLDGIKGDCVMSADMGDGNDLLDVSGNNSAGHPGYTPPPALSLNFTKITMKYDGGKGNDTCRMSMTDLVCVAALDGGDGNDSFTVRDTLDTFFESGDIPDQQDFALRLSGGMGNDNVLIALLMPSVTASGQTISMDLDLGGGSDKLTCSAIGKLQDKASPIFFRVSVAGGDGNDSSSMSFFDVFTECTLDMGAGNDNSFLKFDGIKGQCAVSADMGAGSDSFTVSAASSVLHKGYISPVGASPDSLSIKMDGSDGNDACSVSTSDVFCTMSLDGGAGNDSFVIKGTYSDAQVGDRPTASQFGNVLDSDLNCDISGGAGADVVRCTMKMSPLLADRVVAVSADLGDGSDVFTMDASGDSASAAAGKHLGKIEILCNAGAGNDSVTSTFTDIFADSSLDMGDGNDSVSYKHWGVQGESSLACDLGAGSDTFSSDVSASSNSPPAGVVVAPSAMVMKLDGGDGNDAVTTSFVDEICDFTADMGGGNNRVAGKIKFNEFTLRSSRPSDLSSDAHIGVTCGDGSDNVLIGLLMPADVTPRTAAVDVDCGGGADVFQLDATGVANPTVSGALAAKLYMKLDMGAGSDTARCNLTDVFSDVSATCGDGNDQLYLKYKGTLDLSRCAVDMGAGNDLLDVSATSALSAQQTTPGSALVIGTDCDDGNDTVRMSFFDVFTDVSCDLGAGDNSFTIKQQLSADVDLPPGMLTASSCNVTGGDGNNNVLIALLAPPVRAPAVKPDPTPAPMPPASVRVDLGNGNNTVKWTVDASGPTLTTSASGLTCEISCGDGSNSVTTQIGSPQASSAALFDPGSVSLDVTCGNGGNTISSSLYCNFAVGEVCDDSNSSGDGVDRISHSMTIGQCDGSVRLVVDSGAGADQVLAVVAGDLNGDGYLDMVVDGGAGADTVSCKVTPVNPPAISFTLHVSLEIDGSEGDDTLTLVCPDASSSNGTPSSILAVADGGSGYDVGYLSPGVQPIDIEEVHPPL